MLHPNHRILAPPPQPLTPAEGGSDLYTFVSAATSHVMRALQRPRKSRPTKRKVNLRRFLQNQICRSFSDIEAATHGLASSILSQEALALPKALQQTAPLKPHTSQPAQTSSGSFSGIAEAFAAPDPSPSWCLSPESLMPEPDEFFEPIAKENLLGLDPLAPNLLGYDTYPDSQPCVLSTTYGILMEPNVYPPVGVQCLASAATPKAMSVSAYDIYTPF
ncbi:uncharacterized protein C19orf85-like [Python bivittatus]|uniref:Uncharacterized protein C19orf85-like n=1 Tax=Python bivittatus TaxID=176946 RepID=A0A9F5J417_PYTBI|nr:uncharacterized protein C19orf85-like [Python bivittatus]XP_025032066.1 uncharacterized protein C19orf85-like [Python bivittatus]XP_025032067.1 uncharacterized protein C19orf85-like [Python bivittatus]XP_025032068.1 uncharacterized protein C19orf85-like [Python bivittatus]